jgi:hypothetical protein
MLLFSQMAKNLEIVIPGTGGDLNPGMWSYTPENCVAVNWLLREAGFNFDAPDISNALASVRPITLSPEAVDALSPQDRAEYLYEQEVLSGPGCEYPPMV